jgi:hypothetical protein
MLAAWFLGPAFGPAFPVESIPHRLPRHAQLARYGQWGESERVHGTY